MTGRCSSRYCRSSNGCCRWAAGPSTAPSGATALRGPGGIGCCATRIAALGNAASVRTRRGGLLERAARDRRPEVRAQAPAALARIARQRRRPRALDFDPCPACRAFPGIHYALDRFGRCDRARPRCGSRTTPTRPRRAGGPHRPRLSAIRRDQRRAAAGAAGAGTSATRCASSTAPSRTRTPRRRSAGGLARGRHARAARRAGGLLLPSRHGIGSGRR